MFKTNQNIDISWQSIFRFYIILLAFLAAWYFRQIIFIVLLSFIVASLLDKPVDYLEAKWKNRWLATFAVYFLCLICLGLIAYWCLPVLNNYFTDFSSFLPSWLSRETLLELWQDWQASEPSIAKGLALFGISQEKLSEFLIQSFSFVAKILGGVSTAFFVLLFSFFINTEKEGIERAISLIFPKDYEGYVIYLWGKTRQKVSIWFFSQLILSGIVGGLVFLSLKILGVSQAGLLAILAAIFDFIPYIGPVIIGLVAVLVGLSEDLLLGLSILIIFVVIQGIEGFISPLLRARTMHLSPLAIILALLVGGKLAGIAGIIIALPLAAAVVELIKDVHSGRLASYLPQKQLL